MAQNFSGAPKKRPRSRTGALSVSTLERQLGRAKAHLRETRKGSPAFKKASQVIDVLQSRIDAAKAERVDKSLAATLAARGEAKKMHPGRLELQGLSVQEARRLAEQEAGRKDVIEHTGSLIDRGSNWNSTGLLDVRLSPSAMADLAGPRGAGNRIHPAELERIQIGRSILAGKRIGGLELKPEYNGLDEVYLRGLGTKLSAIHDELADTSEREGGEPIMEGQFIDQVVRSGMKGSGGDPFDPIVAGIYYRLKRYENMSPALQAQRTGSKDRIGLGMAPVKSRVPLVDPENVESSWLDQPPPGSNETLGDYEGELGKPGDRLWLWQSQRPGTRRRAGSTEIEPTRPRHLRDPRSLFGGVKYRPQALDPDTSQSGRREKQIEIMNLPGDSLAEKFKLRRERIERRALEFGNIGAH